MAPKSDYYPIQLKLLCIVIYFNFYNLLIRRIYSNIFYLLIVYFPKKQSGKKIHISCISLCLILLFKPFG